MTTIKPLSPAYYLHAALIAGCMAACVGFVVAANYMAALFFYFLAGWPNAYAAHYREQQAKANTIAATWEFVGDKSWQQPEQAVNDVREALDAITK